MSLPRGIRNNNPLNIRRTGDKWRGLSRTQSDPSLTSGRLCSGSEEQKQASLSTRYDAEFCQFETLEWGWRAAFCLLTKTYFARYHLQTIRAIVSRWAPESENNTRAYIQNVSRLTAIAPDEPLGDPHQHPHRWMLIGGAMATQENGTTSIDWFAMLRGWGMVDG